ncbi:Endonuclease/exonuclease/phosphatase [Neurospora hispaniola]|uniref:Endonuclease/exonuclease/phosphatase n=1 Tax=Neurospora hispaniola TaxID=588809 RepID=A0AAJ0IF40_9PEZI|nr:Endonuclease/exonuclease/phosphatase [Neurospora hispaniola]
MTLRESPAPGSAQLHVRFVSFNIRFATDNPVPGEQPWTDRRPRLCAQLNFLTSGHDSTFLCLQEVLYSQLLDIQDSLGPSWSHVGRGREDGKLAGEFSPIFFRVDEWDCQDWKTYWLSETPERPSIGWDAVLERIVTVGSFRHKTTSKAVIVMTHRDSYPPLVLGGDLNSTPIDQAYKTLTSPDSGLQDTSAVFPDELKYGNRDITYTSFGEPDEEPKTIDFLFVQRPPTLILRLFGILPNKFDDGIFLSDHRPIFVDMEV